MLENFRFERCKRLGPELGTVALLNQIGEVRVD